MVLNEEVKLLNTLASNEYILKQIYLHRIDGSKCQKLSSRYNMILLLSIYFPAFINKLPLDIW